MGWHCFGVKFEGHRARLHGEFNDQEFAELTAKGLPLGWFAWHFENTENIDNSKRVQEVAKLPVLTGGNPYWSTVVPNGHVMAKPYLKEYLRTGRDPLLNPTCEPAE
jgi:hypothetical protein